MLFNIFELKTIFLELGALLHYQILSQFLLDLYRNKNRKYEYKHELIIVMSRCFFGFWVIIIV